MLLAFDWTQLAQQIVIGLSSGGVWATLAVALVLIYRSTGVVNFAQGEMAMFSTFIAWSLVHHGLSYWGAFFLTVALSFVGGVAVERVVIRPVERAPVLTVVIVTLGLFFLVNGAARWIWSPEVRSLPNAFSTRPIDDRRGRVLDPGPGHDRGLAGRGRACSGSSSASPSSGSPRARPR